MGDDMRFAGRGGHKKGEKRKRVVEKKEERTVVVRMNGRKEESENAMIVELHKLEGDSLEELRQCVGDGLYGGTPCHVLYHDDGIPVKNYALIKDGETLYSTHTSDEIFMGCTPDNVVQFTPCTSAGAAPGRLEEAKTELAIKGVLTSSDDYIPTDKFIGTKKGYFFGTYEDRLGYHKDQWGDDSYDKPELSELLSVYGGGDYLGRSRNVHAIGQRAEPRLASTTALPSIRKDQTPAPRGPCPDRLERERAVREAKDQQQKAFDSEMAKVPKDGASTQRSTLSALAALLHESRRTDTQEVQEPQVAFKSRSKKTKTEETEVSENPEKTKGLAEQEAEQEKQAADRPERMSKRARRRAKKREGQDDAQDQ